MVMLHFQKVSLREFLVTTRAAEWLFIMTSCLTLVVLMLHLQRVSLCEFFVKHEQLNGFYHYQLLQGFLYLDNKTFDN